MESIEKVKEEKGISIYGIYEDGGMIIDKGITCFGKIDLFWSLFAQINLKFAHFSF